MGGFRMDKTILQWMHGLLFCLGLILIIGAIATHKTGAMVIGLILAAVNIQQWQMLRIKQSPADKG
jgi:hypothetical protein